MTKKSSELHDEGWGGQQVLRVHRNICKAFVMEVGLGFEEARGESGLSNLERPWHAMCVNSRIPSKVATYVVNLVEEEVICRSTVTL